MSGIECLFQEIWASGPPNDSDKLVKIRLSKLHPNNSKMVKLLLMRLTDKIRTPFLGLEIQIFHQKASSFQLHNKHKELLQPQTDETNLPKSESQILDRKLVELDLAQPEKEDPNINQELHRTLSQVLLKKVWLLVQVISGGIEHTKSIDIKKFPEYFRDLKY